MGEFSTNGSDKKKLHAICWEAICRPKNIGGLAVASLHITNIALMSKWLWKLKCDRNCMVSRVLIGKYREELIDNIYRGEYTMENMAFLLF